MASIIDFDEYRDERGNLCVFDYLPFPLKRVFTITDATAPRGNHSHKECHQIIIALRGKFSVFVEGLEYFMDRPDKGLWVMPGECVRLDNWEGDAAVIVLCSEHYDPKDLVKCT